MTFLRAGIPRTGGYYPKNWPGASIFLTLTLGVTRWRFMFGYLTCGMSTFLSVWVAGTPPVCSFCASSRRRHFLSFDVHSKFLLRLLDLVMSTTLVLPSVADTPWAFPVRWIKGKSVAQFSSQRQSLATVSDWESILSILRAHGSCEFSTKDGRRTLDFTSGVIRKCSCFHRCPKLGGVSTSGTSEVAQELEST